MSFLSPNTKEDRKWRPVDKLWWVGKWLNTCHGDIQDAHKNWPWSKYSKLQWTTGHGDEKQTEEVKEEVWQDHLGHFKLMKSSAHHPQSVRHRINRELSWYGSHGYEKVLCQAQVCNARTWKAEAERSQVLHYMGYMIKPFQNKAKQSKMVCKNSRNDCHLNSKEDESFWLLQEKIKEI